MTESSQTRKASKFRDRRNAGITLPSEVRLSTAQAANHLGVSPATMRSWRLRGPDDPNPGPKYIRLSPSLVVYDVADLDAFLATKRAATYGPVAA